MNGLTRPGGPDPQPLDSLHRSRTVPVAASTAKVRAVGIARVELHVAADGQAIGATRGLHAEMEADDLLMHHVQDATGWFEWWVTVTIVLDDGQALRFDHLVEANEPVAVRQAALLHCAWRLLDPAIEDLQKRSFLALAARLAGKPLALRRRTLNPFELPQGMAGKTWRDLGLRIMSRPHAGAISILADFNQPLACRLATLQV